MTRYILLRTCETDFDLEGRIKGTLDLPLNKHGHDQAIDIAHELSSFKVNAVYYSASQSSAQTADALSREIGIKPKQLKHLHNLNHGLWQGKRVEELREKQKKAYRQWQESPESACPPEGEMLSDAQSRVKSTLDKLTRKHKNHIIVVVAPEPLYSLMCSYLEESELGDLWETICAAGTWRLVDTERLPLTTANHS